MHIYVLVAVCAASKAVRLIQGSSLTAQSMALAFTHLTARINNSKNCLQEYIRIYENIGTY